MSAAQGLRGLVTFLCATLVCAIAPGAAPAAAANPCTGLLTADMSVSGLLNGYDSATKIYEKTVTLRVDNHGMDCSGTVTLKIGGLTVKPNISSQSGLVDPFGDAPCTWSAGTITCTWDNFGPGGWVLLFITLPPGFKSGFLTAHVSAVQKDPNLGNNSRRNFVCAPGARYVKQGPYYCSALDNPTPRPKPSPTPAAPSPAPSPTPSPSVSASPTPSVDLTPPVLAASTPGAAGIDPADGLWTDFVWAAVCALAALILVSGAVTGLVFTFHRRRRASSQEAAS